MRSNVKISISKAFFISLLINLNLYVALSKLGLNESLRIVIPFVLLFVFAIVFWFLFHKGYKIAYKVLSPVNILVFLLGVAIFEKANALNSGILSITIVSTVIALHSNHMENLSGKISEKINAKVEPLRCEIDASNSVIYLRKVFRIIPKFKDYGKSIEKKLSHEFEMEIITAILEEQIRFLGEKHRTMSRDTYLQILQKFNSRYEELYCINKTLPIYWFSPFPDERGFIDEYTNQKSDIRTTRYTLVKSKKDLLNQFQNAFEVVKRWEEKDIACWGLVLFYRIMRTTSSKEQSSNNSKSGTMPKKKKKEKKENNKINNVFNYVTSNLDAKFERGLVSIFNEQDGSDNATKKIQKLLKHWEDETKKIAIKLRQLVENPDRKDLLNLLNQRINEKFIEINKTNGSYFITKDDAESYFKENKVIVEDYGEYGAYLDENKNVKRAFATIGNFGAIIRLEILRNGEQLMEGFQSIAEMSLSSGEGEDIGNMEKLYED